jgi:hypothetical protein
MRIGVLMMLGTAVETSVREFAFDAKAGASIRAAFNAFRFATTAYQRATAWAGM